MHKFFDYSFEWDPVKAWSNYKKHGITFEIAVTVFNDPKAISIFDEGHSDIEDRWVTLGLGGNAIFIVVHHTFRRENDQASHIRIISARKATKIEIKQYQEIE